MHGRITIRWKSKQGEYRVYVNDISTNIGFGNISFLEKCEHYFDSVIIPALNELNKKKRNRAKCLLLYSQVLNTIDEMIVVGGSAGSALALREIKQWVKQIYGYVHTKPNK